MNIKTKRATFLSATTLGLLMLTACQQRPDHGLGHQCADKLHRAQEELHRAKVDGFNGTVAWTKAASLITAAGIQKQFEKYPNCIDKADRARGYIRESRH